MKTKDLVIVGMFTSIIAVLGLLPPVNIPGIPVPFTFQNLGFILAGCLLGRKLGGLSVILFTILVAIGLPVLSGGRGGFALFFGPTGGYILSFPIVAYLIGLFVDKMNRPKVWHVFIINVLIGALLCNFIGGTFMAMNLKQDFITAYKSVLVFLPGDCIKGFIAAILAVKLRSIPSIQKSLSTSA